MLLLLGKFIDCFGWIIKIDGENCLFIWFIIVIGKDCGDECVEFLSLIMVLVKGFLDWLCIINERFVVNKFIELKNIVRLYIVWV